MSKVETGGSFDHSSHEVIKFKISIDGKKSASKTSALDMSREDFGLLRGLISKVPWEKVFADAGVITAGQFLNIIF